MLPWVRQASVPQLLLPQHQQHQQQHQQQQLLPPAATASAAAADPAAVERRSHSWTFGESEAKGGAADRPNVPPAGAPPAVVVAPPGLKKVGSGA